MTQTEDIIENYRKGDLQKRLNLFLECPFLRETFQKIDHERFDNSELVKAKKAS